MFTLLWLAEIVTNLIGGTITQSLVETQLRVNPVHVLDLDFVLTGMIITAVLLWKESFLGYLIVVPLLIFAATMGLGIIAMFSISTLKRTVVLLTGRDHGWNNYHNFNGLFLLFPESNKGGLKKNLHISRK